MIDKDQAILINVPNNYPTALYQHMDEEAEDLGRRIKIEKQEREAIYAGIEWALPTMVIAYLLKPFFESFLQEAGKDFYTYSKTKLKRFIRENRAVKTKFIAAARSSEKLSVGYDQSRTVSLKVKFHSQFFITVLFDEHIPQEQLDECLELLFYTLNELYKKAMETYPEQEMQRGGQELFLLADLDSKVWNLVDKQHMFQRYNNKTISG